MNTPFKSQSEGWTLIDLMLGLGLSLVLITGVYAMSSLSSGPAGVSQEVSHLSALRNAVQGAYGSNKTFAGISSNTAEQDGWYPRGFDDQNSPWGSFGLAPKNFNQPDDGWQAIYQSVPPSACTQLVSHELFKGWSVITVDGKDITDLTGQNTPVDPSIACQASTTHPTHEIRFAVYGGERNQAALAPICFNHSREWIAANGAPAGCPTALSAYNP